MLWLLLGDELSKDHASSVGGKWRPVRCESCAAEWAYHLTVKAAASSSYGRGEAQQTAEYRMMEALDRAGSEVPCPTCGRYQASMVPALRKRYKSWLGTAGWITFTVGGAVAFFGSAWIAFSAVANPKNTVVESAFAILGAIVAPFLLGGVGAYVLRGRLRAKFDPNADAAARAGRPSLNVPILMRAEHERLGAEAAEKGTPPPPPIDWSATG
jgi:hypothetical protein